MSKSGAENCYADKSKVDPQSVIKNNISSNREGNLAFMLALARSKQFPDTTLISRVQCPTLIVWGKQDKIIPVEHAERFRHDIKNSEVLIFDSCGHVPMIEKTKETHDAVLRFFKE
ncbi:MAG TPA: alpha/beta hydrolase, partial [Bacteroidia bacterium]|nr:alpha/beta hydrolase [Bacteroidia bacterium]